MEKTHLLLAVTFGFHLIVIPLLLRKLKNDK